MGKDKNDCLNNQPEHIDNTHINAELIAKLYFRPTWYSYVNERLMYKEYEMPENTDENLDTLISWYVDKNSKKVKYAGTLLRKAFLNIPPAEQRKVGLALFTGSETDVEWLCKRLDNYKPAWNKEWVVNWHPCYSEALENAWEKYKSKFCGRLLIQFLDEEIVRKHLDELLKDDDLYFGLCRRFVNKKWWFTVDKERLAKCTTINAYLSIMSQIPQSITHDEAKLLLYKWIATLVGEYKGEISRFKHEHMFWRYENNEHRVRYAWGIDTALYYLLNMNQQGATIDFLRWDKEIYDTYYSEIGKENDSSDNHDRFVDIIYENIPEEYRIYSHIDTDNYSYFYSAGQPYVKPIIKKWNKDQEYRYSPYLRPFKSDEQDELEKSGDINEDFDYFSDPLAIEEEFQGMIQKFPNLQSFVDKLELKPVGVSKDNNSEIRDLPF